MKYHIVLNRPSELGKVDAESILQKRPRHSMAVLAKIIHGEVHDGNGLETNLCDKFLARLTRTQPLWWAIARHVRRSTVPGDVVYCTGEDTGLIVAALCGRRRQVRVVVMAHKIDGFKKRAALHLLRSRRRVALFLAVAKPQAEFLQRFMKEPARAQFLWDQTDTEFFTPGPPSATKTKPLVVSVGLEQRDFQTLADATSDLGFDVRLSGFSADTRRRGRPGKATSMPDHFQQKYYTWQDLRQLYRDADVVAVILHPNSYAAGVQSLMEAVACGRPVIATRTDGLVGYLDAEGVSSVGAESVAELAVALQGIAKLDESAAASRNPGWRPQAAAKVFLLEDHVNSLACILRQIADHND